METVQSCVIGLRSSFLRHSYRAVSCPPSFQVIMTRGFRYLTQQQMSAHVELVFKTQNTSYKTFQPTHSKEHTFGHLELTSGTSCGDPRRNFKPLRSSSRTSTSKSDMTTPVLDFRGQAVEIQGGTSNHCPVHQEHPPPNLT